MSLLITRKATDSIGLRCLRVGKVTVIRKVFVTVCRPLVVLGWEKVTSCHIILTTICAQRQKDPALSHHLGFFMRIKVHCQNRIGILRDILNLLVEYGVNVAKGEVGGEHGNAIYLFCPNLVNMQFQALRPQFEAIAGVFGVKRVGLMPSERRHMELNALLGALEFPVLSIDMGGSIVAANRAAAQLLGVRVDEVPGIPLSRYAEDFDLPELVRASKSRINGLRVKVKGCLLYTSDAAAE